MALVYNAKGPGARQIPMPLAPDPVIYRLLLRWDQTCNERRLAIVGPIPEAKRPDVLAY
jgi:hypothetical protein